MNNAYKRKKQPDRVRQAILDYAEKFVIQHGLQALSLQAVADGAGVTKGGLLHHFSSKAALLSELSKTLIHTLELDINERICRDPQKKGCFTRAYLQSVMDSPARKEAAQINALFLLMLSDASLRDFWNEWIASMHAKYADSDGCCEHVSIRLAADGIWLADICGTPVPQRETTLQNLLQRSYE